MSAAAPSGPPPALSVLDLSPVPSGSLPSRALHETVELARTAERLGYTRYWLAEHHNLPSLASSSPEVMVAAVAAATSTLRVGTGGVMLPNHSPLRVAETFRVLHGLHPGRIDLGIGRAPGTDGRTAIALRRSRDLLGADDFEAQFEELHGYAEGFPAGHPFASITAVPGDVPLPPVWILGSSTHGAQVAARLGTGYAYAGHFGSADAASVVRSYRAAFRPSPSWPEPHAVLALAVLCAPTEERAEELALASDLAFLRLRSGRPGPLPSPEEAAAHPWTELDRALAAENRSRLVSGTPEQVVARLHALAAVTTADELMVMTNVHDPAERRLSYELLARAAGLPGR
ncbi:LLM class flavin-dependent oxidoreductase [Kineococcus sp. NUM-3379]